MIFKSTFLCPYQYFIFIAWKSLFQILYTAHYCIMNFFSSSKTEPAVSYNIKILKKGPNMANPNKEYWHLIAHEHALHTSTVLLLT